MSCILEVYYGAPTDPSREEKIAVAAAKHGGVLNFKEEPTGGPSKAMCLTFEFANRPDADSAAVAIRLLREHVEGPSDYG